MKKLFLTIFMILGLIFAPVVWAAITWHTANQFTVAWGPVTTNVGGGAVPANEIEYEVFLANAVTDPGKTSAVSVWRGATVQATVTLNTEGAYLVGVKAIRVVDGIDQAESIRIWSDDPTYCYNGVTFGVRHYVALSNPTDFQPQ